MASGNASLGVLCDIPVVNPTSPTNFTVNLGDPAVFSVSATGTPTLMYQWRRGPTNLINGGSIFGATSPNLNINPTALADAGNNYNCLVTNPCGGTVSVNFTLNVHQPCYADCFPNGGDGVVNIDDLVRVITSWGFCPGPGSCPADVAPPLAGNGLVNIDDLVLVITSWGRCPAP